MELCVYVLSQLMCLVSDTLKDPELSAEGPAKSGLGLRGTSACGSVRARARPSPLVGWSVGNFYARMHQAHRHALVRVADGGLRAIPAPQGDSG